VGITGECNLSSNTLILVMSRYPIRPVVDEVNRIPSQLNIPPIRNNILNLPKLRNTNPNPSMAEVQKLSPLSAIYKKYFILLST
jgi:hypothetical protein